MKLSNIADLFSTTVIGHDAAFDFVSTDTRTLKSGQLFLALQGPNFDGNDYVSKAKELGAVAAIVSRATDTDLPTLLVEDTFTALGKLATFKRQQFSIPIVAVTGSCGKTTTKAMLASILSQAGDTLSTTLNENNGIGVPLTLLRLADNHKFAVIEMGTDQLGEIAYVSNVAQPTIAMITNAAPVHLDALVDVEGVSREKGDIFQGLVEDGVAVLNADDIYFDYWRTLNQHRRCISFGMQNSADFSAKNSRDGKNGFPAFRLITPVGETDVQLTVPGEHNVMNALAAASGAYAAGADLQIIRHGLEAMVPVEKRMVQYQGYNGSTIIDDSYNANPSSLKAAMRVLIKTSGETALVLGDMAGLGDKAREYHVKIGEEAKALGVQRLFAVGKLTPQAVEAFGDGAEHFSDKALLMDALKQQLHEKMTLLVKGSNINKLWEVSEALKQKEYVVK